MTVDKQPRALYLAKELRRLHAENEDYGVTCDHLIRENAEHIGEIVALKGQRDELLEALRWYVETDEVSEMAGNEFWLEGRDRARAAIAKAGGGA